MIWRLAQDLIYLNFDLTGISRAQKLKMKYQKITYFRHYVPFLDESEKEDVTLINLARIDFENNCVQVQVDIC